VWVSNRKWCSSALLSTVLAEAITGGCSSSTSHSGTSSPETTCVPPATGLPSDVFCLGLYENRDQNHVSQEVMPYTPGIVLWSDGAEKHRYLYLPAGTQIDTSNMDAWQFPVGTKVFKEFRLQGTLVETRAMLKRDGATWDVGTYVWSPDGASAMLSTNTKGTVLPSGYEIPGVKDCDKCHHGGADRLLGVEAIALALPKAQGLPLSELVNRGLLTNLPPTTSVTLPEDATGKAAEAIGYLHMNCGVSCHSNRGLGNDTGLLMRLRAEEIWPLTPGAAPATAQQTDIYSKSVNSAPTTGAIADHFPGTVRISPGSHASSLIWILPHRRDAYQMPPLVSHVVDDAGTKIIADWIDALPQ
jgi:hypothetical protein